MKFIGLQGQGREIELQGEGWINACKDIVFPGLGWVSVTGSMKITVRAIGPGGAPPVVREPIMHSDTRKLTKKWTGDDPRRLNKYRSMKSLDPDEP